eukprot:COSAG01_NODE_16549_length_1227_cov_0.907801_3_plen_84_part_00
MITELSVCLPVTPPSHHIRASAHIPIHILFITGALSHTFITRACSVPCRSQSRWDTVSDPSLSTSAQSRQMGSGAAQYRSLQM